MMALEKIRVADFTTMLAGAGVCREMADLGADVIKIEPADGDSWRMLAGGFMGVNRGKRGIVIDLRKEEAKPIAYKLISTCDMIVENSRPGIMQKLGMTTVRQEDRRIHLYLTTRHVQRAGCRAPRLRPAFQRAPDVRQGRTASVPVFHKTAQRRDGPMLAPGIAIFHKRTQVVVCGNIVIMSGCTSPAILSGTGAKRKYLGKPDIKGLSALNRLYQGIDGNWLYVYCPKDAHWKALCKVLGLTALTTDPRFDTPGARKKHDKELAAILEETFFTTPAIRRCCWL
jgi:crotonobetainyl-CoA:carnitine CoA-transferase CaiB-like acyl-CoA transferase